MQNKQYKYIVILKGTNKEFAIHELQELWNLYFNEKTELKQLENMLYKFSSKHLIKSNHELLTRLTFTTTLCLNTAQFKSIEELKKNTDKLQISAYDSKKYRVRTKKVKKSQKIQYHEKDLATIIWDSFTKPKVSIKDFDIEFNFIFLEKNPTFYFGIQIFQNQRDYLTRMPKLRPVKMPYTLKSDMARATINLLNIKPNNNDNKKKNKDNNNNQIILDPFCGIGGILLEACDMNFKIIGNDISWNDLKYLKQNFTHYYPKTKYIRILADSQTQFLKTNSVDGIVTDIPYGKCSRKLGTDLYEKFLESAKQYLKPNKRIAIIYANFTEFKPLALKYFKEVIEIEEYINKSMTRHILILENKK